MSINILTMAFGKTLFVLFLGLLAVQAYTDAEEIESPMSAVEELLKQLTKAVEKGINTALSQLNGFIHQVNEAAKEFEQVLNKTLVDTCKPFVDEINKAVDAAAKAGVNVVSCVGNSTTEILDLPGQLIANVSSCVDTQVKEADKVINNFINDAKRAMKVVTAIGHDISNCSRQSIVVMPFCIAKITANITAEMVSLPLQISQDVVKAKIYVASIIPDIAACDFGAKVALVKTAGSIAGDVTKCIANKMSAATGTPTAGTGTTNPATGSTNPGTGSAGTTEASDVTSKGTEAPATAGTTKDAGGSTTEDPALCSTTEKAEQYVFEY